jgi:hypothetical protein
MMFPFLGVNGIVVYKMLLLYLGIKFGDVCCTHTHIHMHTHTHTHTHTEWEV